MRLETITTKVRTSFGSIFIHTDHDERGRAQSVGIAYPGKFKHSELGNALDLIADTISDSLRAPSRPGFPAQSDGLPLTPPAPHGAGDSLEGGS